MDNADFSLGLDVVLSDNATMTEPLVDELMTAIQEKILPSLAGCNIQVDEFVEEWRFVIFDAFVNGKVETDKSCEDEVLARRNCHFVSTQLDLFLKGRVRFLDIIDLISDEEANISDHLGLSQPFEVVKLVKIENLTPTAVPSAMPSDVPSTAPSIPPSALPIGQYTPEVTSLPTIAPTKIIGMSHLMLSE